MKCENCGVNNATTHIKKVINGVVTEQHLCQICAAKKGYSTLGNNSLAGMLASVFGDSLNDLSITKTEKCSGCGSTFSDIVNYGKVGCSNCYKEFYDELLPYLKRIHGSVNHVGKIPNRAPLSIKNDKTEIELLRAQLSEVILKEEFEKAAEIRDRIRQLEGQGDNNE